MWVERERIKSDLEKAHQGLMQLEHYTKQKDERMVYRLTHAYAGNGSSTKTQEQALQDAQAATRDVYAIKDHIEYEMLRLAMDGVIPPVSAGAAVPCVQRRLNPRLYNRVTPVVSFLLQYYKRPWFIPALVQGVQQCAAAMPVELVVNVDSPGEHAVWAGLAMNATYTASANFSVVPVFSANVHEARGYNRAAALARGRYIVILQDDEMAPGDCTAWLPNLVTIFERWPAMGVVGLRNPVIGPGPDFDNGARRFFTDPSTGVAMHWVYVTDFAPLAARRSALRAVGGIDEGMMEPGQCAIITDWELCKRMWTAGYQVSYMNVNRDGRQDRSGNPSGTHTPESEDKCWGAQMRRSQFTANQRWGEGHWEPAMQWVDHVRRLNLRHLKLIDKCPYVKAGCSL
uniref:Glycosyltransferase 2-like domain-containing protein n=1 Tax=Chlamydomonas leiostraca TaxID=1034604 RepID=A0A7S0R483_9CHLO